MDERKNNVAILSGCAIVLAWLLAGCTSTTLTEYDAQGRIVSVTRDGRCTVQNHGTTLGIDIELFDVLMNGQSSPSKLRIGYITSDQQITPQGMAAESRKTYDDILGDNKIKTDMKAGNK